MSIVLQHGMLKLGAIAVTERVHGTGFIEQNETVFFVGRGERLVRTLLEDMLHCYPLRKERSVERL